MLTCRIDLDSCVWFQKQVLIEKLSCYTFVCFMRWDDNCVCMRHSLFVWFSGEWLQSSQLGWASCPQQLYWLDPSSLLAYNVQVPGQAAIGANRDMYQILWMHHLPWCHEVKKSFLNFV